ncbi:unnamed protein product [Rotaria sp. Silwood1]|nr:unnamed protein product [Rotaria sp. Silwood1]CAF1674663.1 unnamed protein product [Rotaria sp. Silwood1]
MRILIPLLTRARITFNDLSIADEKSQSIPNMYRRLEWNKIYYAHVLHLNEKLPKSVDVTSVTSGNSLHVAWFSKNAWISGENLNETFTFVSLTAYGAWNDDMQLMVTIHRNSALIYTYTTTYSF